MSKRKLDSEARRRFLQGLGSLGGLQAVGLSSSALLLPSLGCERAGSGPSTGSRASDPGFRSDHLAPQRLLIVFTLHGTIYDQWKMHPEGAALDQRWTSSLAGLDEQSFSPILRPLHPWRDRMSVYDGLSLVSAELERNNVRHIIGALHAMTGAMSTVISSATVGSAPSIDQRIADHIARPDQFRSLELCVGEPLVEIVTRDAQQVLPLQRDPQLTLAQLFGIGDSEFAGQAQAEVFSRAGNLYGEFAAGLASEDRQRLDIHRELLHELELRAQGLAATACEAPTLTGIGGVNGDYDENFADFSQLLTTAFACDLTRVATFYLSTQPAARIGLSGDMHQDYAHQVYSDPAAAEAMSSYALRHAQDLAELLESLDAIPEGDGSLLDNTTVVWCGELADGNHGYERWPVVVVGGQGLRKGNYEYWPSDTPFAGYQWDGTRSESMAVPHEKFLVALAQSFGVDIEAMPIASFEGIDGAKIDCSGPLDGVLV